MSFCRVLRATRLNGVEEEDLANLDRTPAGVWIALGELDCRYAVTHADEAVAPDRILRLGEGTVGRDDLSALGLHASGRWLSGERCRLEDGALSCLGAGVVEHLLQLRAVAVGEAGLHAK